MTKIASFGIGIYFEFGTWKLVLILLFSLIGKSFVNQHYGDIVLNGIEQLAGLADQAISFAIQENISFTFRACQYFQKFFTDRHLLSSFPLQEKRSWVQRVE
jgi:hypothetical protein